MPSVNPCLGCGFRLDADGYLVRTGEISRAVGGDWSPGPGAGNYKYCDPGTQRSWDVPWNMPWGQIEDSFNTPNFVPPTSLTTIYASNVIYAPYRRMKLSGWFNYEQVTGFGLFYQLVVNGVAASPEIACGGSVGSTLSGMAPFLYTISGPGMAPYSGLWSAGNPNIQFGVTVKSLNTGIVRVFYACVEDLGPAGGVYYATTARFWPSPLPY